MHPFSFIIKPLDHFRGITKMIWRQYRDKICKKRDPESMKQKHLNTLQVSESLYNMMNHSSRDKGSEYIWKIKIPPSTHQSACPLSWQGEERPFPHVRVRMDALYLSEDTRNLLLLDKVGIGNMKIGLGYLVLYHRTAIISNQFTMQIHPCSPRQSRSKWWTC